MFGELPIDAFFPIVFGCIVYPMAGLQVPLLTMRPPPSLRLSSHIRGVTHSSHSSPPSPPSRPLTPSLPSPLPQCGQNRFLSFISALALQTLTASSIGLTIGSMSPSTEAALAMGPSLMVVFILLSGQVRLRFGC